MNCTSCTNALLPANLGSRAKVLVLTGTISVALIIIAAIAHFNYHLPIQFNATCSITGFVGLIYVAKTLPNTLIRLIVSSFKQFEMPTMVRKVGRKDLVSQLQDHIGIYHGDWDEAVYQLIKSGRIDSSRCHKELVIGEERLANRWPDALSTPSNLCSPVTVKESIDRGYDVTEDPEFKCIVTQLQKRYSQDLCLPLFHLIEEAFDKVQQEMNIDPAGQPVGFSRISITFLLEGATQQNNILTLKSGYRLDFSNINGLTSYQNQEEESLVLDEALRVSDAINNDKIIPKQDIDALANLITQRYLPNWARAQLGETNATIVTAQEELFHKKIADRFEVVSSDWAPAGSCVLASILMCTMDSVNSQDLLDYRKKIAAYLSRHLDEFTPFFSQQSDLEKYVDQIKDNSTYFTPVAIESLARILNRPIHVYTPTSEAFTLTNGIIQPTETFGPDRGNPISILGGLHTEPLFPK